MDFNRQSKKNFWVPRIFEKNLQAQNCVPGLVRRADQLPSNLFLRPEVPSTDIYTIINYSSVMWKTKNLAMTSARTKRFWRLCKTHKCCPTNTLLNFYKLLENFQKKVNIKKIYVLLKSMWPGDRRYEKKIRASVASEF